MKKTNKLIAILIVLAMMTALCAVAAFAEDPAVPQGTAANSYLVKYLEIDEGVTIPNDTFTFHFAGKNSATITDYTGVVPADQTIRARGMEPSASTVDDGALVGKISIETIFNGITFPRAGEYIYTVTETLPASSSEGGSYEAQTQVYELHVYVTNGTNGTEISKVTVEDVTPNDPADPTSVVGEKKDPTDDDPSDGNDPDDPDDDLGQDDISQTEISGFAFDNKYTPDPNKVPDGPYGAFHAQKNITGAYGDKTAQFPITITVTFPSGYNGDKALDILNKSGTKIAELNANGAATVNLADGDIAYFKNLPDGADVTVNEDLTSSTITNAANYEQSAITTTGDVAAAKKTGTAKLGTAADSKENFVADAMTYADANAQKDNSVVVTNENKYDPGATGILMDNLPYIILLVLAGAGLTVYFVSKRREQE